MQTRKAGRNSPQREAKGNGDKVPVLPKTPARESKVEPHSFRIAMGMICFVLLLACTGLIRHLLLLVFCAALCLFFVRIPAVIYKLGRSRCLGDRIRLVCAVLATLLAIAVIPVGYVRHEPLPETEVTRSQAHGTRTLGTQASGTPVPPRVAYLFELALPMKYGRIEPFWIGFLGPSKAVIEKGAFSVL